MPDMLNYIVPVLIVLMLVALFVVLKVAVSRYKKVPPGRVGIFYGMKYRQADGRERGFLVMSGGGRVQRPLLEGYLEIPTTAFQVEINESGIPNKDNVKLTVPGVATCKISTIPENLTKAIDALVDKLTQENGPKRGVTDANPIEEFVRNILKGHLRSIIGKLDINELLRNRDEFNKRVVEESAAELAGFGIELMNLVIQDIIDAEGYIDALGRRAVADAKAEAEIKVAEANRNKEVAVSNANREASLVKADNDAKVAEANKERDLKIAGFKKETETKKAEAEMAGEIALAAQQQTLRVAEAQRDAKAAEAQIQVQEKEAQRKEKELEVTVIKPAEAQRRAVVINAEAAKSQLILQSEAARDSARFSKEATVAAGQAEAEVIKAKLVAKAEGDAATARATLVAQAEGTERLNAALANMTDAAKLILILDRLPMLLDKGGEAGAKVLGSMFEPIAAGLGSIDSVRIVDMGGHGNGMNKMSGVVTDTVFQTLAQLKAKGVDIRALASKAGINLDALDSLLNGIAPAKEDGAGKDGKASDALVVAEIEEPPKPTGKPGPGNKATA